MLDSLFVVQPHPTSKLGFRDNFTDVLENKLVRSQIGLGAKAITLLLRLNDGNISKLLSLEALVSTVGTAATVTHAFDLGSAVDAVRVLSARQVFRDSRFWKKMSERERR